MTAAITYPHIEKIGAEPARLTRVPRTRVAMIVMDYLTLGWSVDEMCRQYPYLRHAEVHSAMAYYFDHRAEIEAEIEAEVGQVEVDRRNSKPSPFLLRMRAEGRWP